MREPIAVNYVPDGRNWTVTVSVFGREEKRRATAPGLIAARDRADQIIEQIEPADRGKKIVVHLLDGDAYAFTCNYLHARLGLSFPAEERNSPGQIAPARSEAASTPSSRPATFPPTQTAGAGAKPPSKPLTKPPAKTPATKSAAASVTPTIGQRKPGIKVPNSGTVAVPAPRTEAAPVAAKSTAPVSAVALAKAAGHPVKPRDKDDERPERPSGVVN